MADNLTVADVLERAADLIEPEGAWTQGAYARDALGKDLTGGDDDTEVPPQATCFCVYGAVAYVEGETIANSEAGRFLEELELSACRWNDAPERTQAEVVSKLREAAALARERGL